jgi:hypothetical protein
VVRIVYAERNDGNSGKLSAQVVDLLFRRPFMRRHLSNGNGQPR